MKILVVDDEKMICEWLSFCVEKNFDCELVGIAYNGEQALKMFRRFLPDVVFSDIKMPIMDGIDLLKIIKEEAPQTKVVLLTAFAEFDLAKEAISFGADEYLLKTEMSIQTFNDIINKLKAKENIKVENNTNLDYQIITDILKEDKILSENDLKRIKDCNIRWRDNGLFALAIWKKDILSDFILPKDPSIRHMFGFEYDNLTYMFVGNMARDLNYDEKRTVLYDYSKKIIKENDCMVGVSSLCDSLVNIMDIINEASYGLSQGYYCESYKFWPTMISSDVIRQLKDENKKYYIDNNKKLYHMGISELVENILSELNRIEAKKVYPISEVINYCFNAINIVYMKFSENGVGLMHALLQEEKQSIAFCVNFKIVKKVVIDLINNIINPQEFNEKDLSNNVSKAVKYIRSHYNYPISLEIIAENINLNPEYLSRIFKDETGMTYSAFLTNVRLKNATYLLNNTNERVKKIAEQVGYPNVSYFSTIFKKKYGLNPYEYRSKKNQ